MIIMIAVLSGLLFLSMVFAAIRQMQMKVVWWMAILNTFAPVAIVAGIGFVLTVVGISAAYDPMPPYADTVLLVAVALVLIGLVVVEAVLGLKGPESLNLMSG